MSLMRDNVKDLVQLVAQTLDVPEPIVEIGSLQVEGQVGYADLRPFFPGKTYIGCDLRQGIGVDRIENVEQLTFEDNSVGTVLMVDTLEHVENCHLALQEIYRVLRPGGFLLLTSVMDFPVHEYPSDYWRFTPHCFELLLKRFSARWVFFQGNPLFPHTVIGLGVKKGEASNLPRGMEELLERMKSHAVPFTSTHYDEARLRAQYPVHQLHEAYHLLADYEAKLRDQAKQLSEVYMSLSWKLIQRYRKLIERGFPPATWREKGVRSAFKSHQGED